MTHDYINFRKRVTVTVPETDGMPEHQLICYGLTSDDITSAREWRDLEDEYRRLSVGGRRPGDPREKVQCFFNRRIMTDEERLLGQRQQAILDRSHSYGIQALDETRSEVGAQEAEVAEGGGGGGDGRDEVPQDRDDYGSGSEGW